MCLLWGIMPHFVPEIGDPQDLIESISSWGIERGMLSKGDRVVFVTGTGVVDNTHNLLIVHEVP